MLVGFITIVLERCWVYRSLQLMRSRAVIRVLHDVKKLTWIHMPTSTRGRHGGQLLVFCSGVNFANSLMMLRTPMFKVSMSMIVV